MILSGHLFTEATHTVAFCLYQDSYPFFLNLIWLVAAKASVCQKTLLAPSFKRDPLFLYGQFAYRLLKQNIFVCSAIDLVDRHSDDCWRVPLMQMWCTLILFHSILVKVPELLWFTCHCQAMWEMRFRGRLAAAGRVQATGLDSPNKESSWRESKCSGERKRKQWEANEACKCGCRIWLPSRLCVFQSCG